MTEFKLIGFKILLKDIVSDIDFDIEQSGSQITVRSSQSIESFQCISPDFNLDTEQNTAFLNNLR